MKDGTCKQQGCKSTYIGITVLLMGSHGKIQCKTHKINDLIRRARFRRCSIKWCWITARRREGRARRKYRKINCGNKLCFLIHRTEALDWFWCLKLIDLYNIHSFVVGICGMNTIWHWLVCWDWMIDGTCWYVEWYIWALVFIYDGFCFWSLLAFVRFVKCIDNNVVRSPRAICTMYLLAWGLNWWGWYVHRPGIIYLSLNESCLIDSLGSLRSFTLDAIKHESGSERK